MATKSSLIITATDYVTGKAQQKTVTDINPQASSSHLLTWAQSTMDMTKDSYIKSKRIDVIELDVQKTARATTQKLLQISKLTSEINILGQESATVDIPLSSINDDVYAFDIKLRTNDLDIEAHPRWIGEQKVLHVAWHGYHERIVTSSRRAVIVTVAFTKGVQTFSGILHIDENDTYQALDLPITINIYDDTEESDSDGE